MEVKVISGKNPNVWKYVFIGKDYVAEAVLYRYNSFRERTVICCSVQSGCPVGCQFCGTGKYFLKNLSDEEIISQIKYILSDKNINPSVIKKFQIMFMSMGEPMLNWQNTKEAIKKLHKLYPSAQLLLSTIGIKNKSVLEEIITISKEIPQIGLQFSIHQATDERRSRLIPYPGKLTLIEVADFGQRWHKKTKRYPFLNYIVTNSNSNIESAQQLRRIFDPKIFRLTLSVLCEIDKNKNPKTEEKLRLIKKIQNLLLSLGFAVRIFNPAGHDDIGGGCGQLWYIQEHIKKLAAKHDKTYSYSA